MKEYKVELRATPDTDQEEDYSVKHGGASAGQTIYYRLYASSYEEACKRAVETEQLFTHRRDRTLTVEYKGKKISVDLIADVWVFGDKDHEILYELPV